MNSFMRQKLLSAKEDLLQSNAKAKRFLRLMVHLDHYLPSTKQLATSEWKLRIEGRVLGASADREKEEDDILKSDKRLLSFFERVRIEFPGNEDLYPAVEWVKAKSVSGSSFDCLEIGRSLNKEQKKKLNDGVLKIAVKFYLENNPRRYKLSQTLSRVLGGVEEASRLQIIGALWQYIKSHRLQDSEAREVINCNEELADVFGCAVGEEKLEFHQAVFRLKPHLQDIPPLELVFDMHVCQKSEVPDTYIYELSVFEHGGNHKEQIDFLVKCDYDFFSQHTSDEWEDTKRDRRLSIQGSILKQKECQYNDKIHAAISQMKRSYKQMHFFNRLGGNVKAALLGVIVQQNRWLRVMQED